MRRCSRLGVYSLMGSSNVPLSRGKPKSLADCETYGFDLLTRRYLQCGADHSPLIFASLMTGHHFSNSALVKAPSASGVCSSRNGISWPMSASRERTVASASAAATLALSLSTTDLGVPLGA